MAVILYQLEVAALSDFKEKAQWMRLTVKHKSKEKGRGMTRKRREKKGRMHRLIS